MPGNSREMMTAAERRFPVRIRLGVPSSGFGQRQMVMTAWLDENCGADGWAMTPSGMRGVLNDAVSIYFLDATLASAFVAGGALARGSRRMVVCSGFAMTSRCRGSGRGCIGHRKAGNEWDHRPVGGGQKAPGPISQRQQQSARRELLALTRLR